MPPPPNTIIKPSVLTSDGSSSSQSNPNDTNILDLTQLQNMISEIVKTQTQQMFDRVSNGDTQFKIEVDQNIEPRYINDLNDMDRIPDVVKSLREFSGQPGEFGSWRKSVDRILRIYDNLKGTPKYYGILSVIRNKITGNADTALESYNTPLCWDRISKCLTLHYADKRDLGTLEYQMTTLVQRNSSIPEFYQQVYQHLSFILNKLSSMDMSQESMNVMTQSYRDKALDTFVRGLRGDLPRLLSMRGPVDLPEALHLCLKLENVQYRVQHSHSNVNIRYTQLPNPPPIARNIPMQQHNMHTPQLRNFYPELLHSPQIPQSFPKQFQHPYQYPQIPQNFPKQFQYPFNNANQFQHQPRIPNRNYLPKPQPMDVDPSIHSRQVNYQNRPQMNKFANKRPYSNQVHQPNKLQRVYHTDPHVENNDIECYQDQLAEYDSQQDQTLLEYTDSIENPNTIDDEQLPITEQLDDVHFLIKELFATLYRT